MKIQKTNVWRGLRLAVGAVVVGLLISSIALAQRGGGGHGGGRASSGAHAGSSRMGGSSALRGGMQRSVGSSNARQGGAGISVNRGSAPSANFGNRNFSSAGNKAQGGGIVSRGRPLRPTSAIAVLPARGSKLKAALVPLVSPVESKAQVLPRPISSKRTLEVRPARAVIATCGAVDRRVTRRIPHSETPALSAAILIRLVEREASRKPDKASLISAVSEPLV